MAPHLSISALSPHHGAQTSIYRKTDYITDIANVLARIWMGKHEHNYLQSQR
jgi:hypothetical protein